MQNVKGFPSFSKHCSYHLQGESLWGGGGGSEVLTQIRGVGYYPIGSDAVVEEEVIWNLLRDHVIRRIDTEYKFCNPIIKKRVSVTEIFLFLSSDHLISNFFITLFPIFGFLPAGQHPTLVIHPITPLPPAHLYAALKNTSKTLNFKVATAIFAKNWKTFKHST